ncbi:MAG: response regulator [Opitutaceae bacterium]|nr:response regulator [Cytophagales bacterium]
MIKRFLYIILFLILCLDTFGQKLDFNFINLGTNEGLSSNTVNSILKDSYGFMWFGTEDGLNKYDGNQCIIYRNKSNDPNSIPSNDIFTIFEDKQRRVWIGTGAGVVMYDRKKDGFTSFKYSNTVVTSICQASDGNIWLGGFGGVAILNPSTKQIYALEMKGADNMPLPLNTASYLFRDHKNRIWMGNNTGLYLYKNDKSTFRRYFHVDNDPHSLSGNEISAICEDHQGQIWIGTLNGLSKLNDKEDGFLNFQHQDKNSNSLSSNLIYCIAPDRNGSLWLGTEESLNILDIKTGKVSRIKRSARSEYNMVGKSVKSILIDNEGIHWVATFRGGVNKYDKNLVFFNLIESNLYDPKGLSSPVVTSFAKSMDKNQLYVGTDGGGLNLFNIVSGAFQHVTLPNISNSANLAILAMERVGSEIWIGTFLQGIFILDEGTGQVRHVQSGNDGEHISGNDIFCINQDSWGRVWLGTNGNGVNYYDPKTKKFVNFSNKNDEELMIVRKGYIRTIEEDKNQQIWIGSRGAGIAVYNPFSKKIKVINSANSLLPNNNVNYIYSATNGLVWIGTSGGGLTRYDQNSSKMNSYSEESGLANNVVNMILEDKQGKIWVTTNKGISSFDPISKTFRNYSHYNGVQRSPFVLGAGLKYADDKLFFGGAEGFNFFNPNIVHSRTYIPKLVLTDLIVSNQSVSPAEDSPISEHISVAKRILLDFKQNFSISFVALNYTSPQDNRYFYKLEKFDKEWNNAGKSNTAFYTNLDPGEYTFKVKATSEAGDWTTKETTIKIYVKPPFWRTYWAYGLYIILTIAILFYIRYRGIQKLKEEFALQQEKAKVQQFIEEERREAERVHEFDQLKIKFLTNISHEFRTPISLIIGPVDQLIQNDVNSSSTHGQLNIIKRNARRLLNLVNHLLDFRNIKTHEEKLNLTEGDFIAFSRDLSESFEDHAERKHIQFKFNSNLRDYYTLFDHNKIERILFNLLSNAFKFTLKGGMVGLEISENKEKNGLLVTVTDTGIGIREDYKEKIFDRFFQSDSTALILNQGSGIGLSIAQEFVKIHDGSIRVESTLGKGTTFTISFPFVRLEEGLNQIQIEHGNEQVIEDEEIFALEEGDNEASEMKLFPIILIVEDNDDFRYYLKENLKSYYRVIEAADGKEGWQKVLSNHPQLVVSDISMPKASGIDLCRKIKSDKRTNHIPVILLTALTAEQDQLNGLETGANDYMTKPFNFQILNVKIRNLLTLNQSLKNTYSKQVKVLTSEVEVVSQNDRLLNKVLQYIEENLNNRQLSVEAMSKHIGMSRGSLYSKLLELTGETPVEFIRSLKLDKAAILLEKSDLNVAQVGYAVGFASPNYFSRAFKTRFGMLPSEYINLKRGEEAV